MLNSFEELGLCALRMEIQNEPRDFLDIVNAEKTDGHLRKRIARLHDGICADDDITRAAVALPMVNRNHISRGAGSHGASAAADDDKDTLVGDRVNGFEPFEISEERRRNDAETNEDKGEAKQREERKDASDWIIG